MLDSRHFLLIPQRPQRRCIGAEQVDISAIPAPIQHDRFLAQLSRPVVVAYASEGFGIRRDTRSEIDQ